MEGPRLAQPLDHRESDIYPPQLSSPERRSRRFAWVRKVHTLGPQGTNCEKAARFWVDRLALDAPIVLHQSIERAATEVAVCDAEVMLGVVAYPDLHSVMYTHVRTMRLLDLFIMNTDEMVMAVPPGRDTEPRICVTHPAPQALLPERIQRRFVASTALAAQECACGRAEGCITTLAAADRHGLRVLHRYGPVPMGFTIHGPAARDTLSPAATCCRAHL
ncbi:prephenate dehydratase [Paracoccus onubensis]|uniref:prephenate dehydratase n=1 Tax=Paracoccus onubensis TaxID=1675788 RepID=UPI002731180C|nr:prephenate dehydratase [Paracoccus onubensis]MDP0929770.1 prephenate dehydratase [Paracoccus onubensis]